jgi:arylsulfatase A-like enzyme
MSEGSLAWRNFEVELPQSKTVQFMMQVKPVISRFSTRDLFNVITNTMRISILAAWTAPEIASLKTDLPDVILISIDTLRADALGCYGCNRNTSPAIDAFAGEGILFKNAFSQSTWTLPSHMSLLTGRFPNELFNTLHYLPLEELETPGSGLKGISQETLPEALGKNGYYCAGFTDGVYVSSYYGFYKGFHYYDEKYGPGENSFKLARQWIDKNKEKRLFLFLHTYLVHDYKWLERGDYVTRKGQTSEETNELLHATRELFPECADPASFLTGDWKKRQKD